MLLVHYKDDPDKLAKIMEKLLDRQVHPLYKAPLLSSFYTNNPTPMSCANGNRQVRQRREGLEAGVAAMSIDAQPAPRGAPVAQAALPREHSPTWEEDYATWQANQGASGEAPGAAGPANAPPGSSSGSRQLISDARNRGMAHRSQRPQPGPGSDSGSSGSGKSSGSDSFASRAPPHPPPGTVVFSDASVPLPASLATSLRQQAPMADGLAGAAVGGTSFGRAGAPAPMPPLGKVSRFKNKRLYPSVPNQPSEASAHFMFELAKTVLLKAGGNSSTSLFTQPINSQNPRGPIRALQMCAFQIGLYALGLHNCVSAKWLSRTYSSHVSWITGNFFVVVVILMRSGSH